MIGYHQDETERQLALAEDLRRKLIIAAITGCAKRHHSGSSFKDSAEDIAKHAIKVADEVLRLLKVEDKYS